MAAKSGTKRFMLAALAVLLIAGVVAAVVAFTPGGTGAERAEVVVYKHPQCGCCSKWVQHLEDAGFDVATRSETDARKRWSEHGVPQRLGSCHTAVVDGYVVEGHVPASDIRRLLEERPDAAGLVVPGMPVGSPGMEGPNPEAYDVLLLHENGAATVYQQHGPGK